MAEELPLSPGGAWFSDVRGPERRLRISTHEEPGHGQVVVSIWRGPICRASAHLDARDVAALVEALAGSEALEQRTSQLEAVVARLRDALERRAHHEVAPVVALRVATPTEAM